jgi:hypothetical protein
MKILYYYFFFKLYNRHNRKSSNRFAEWRAALSILAVEVLLVLCIIGDISIITERDIMLLPYIPPCFLTLIIILAVSKYFVFMKRMQWQKYHRVFQAWPNRRRQIADMLIGGVIFFLVANLIVLYHILDNTDFEFE